MPISTLPTRSLPWHVENTYSTLPGLFIEVCSNYAELDAFQSGGYDLLRNIER